MAQDFAEAIARFSGLALLVIVAGMLVLFLLLTVLITGARRRYRMRQEALEQGNRAQARNQEAQDIWAEAAKRYREEDDEETERP